MSRLDAALNRYYKQFGENYPLSFGSTASEEEIIADINTHIETGTPAEEPEYLDGVLY